MSTLQPPSTKFFPESSIEKKVYNVVDSLAEYIPVNNDRNRLGFGLYKYFNGEGDAPEILLKSAKIKIQGITLKELTAKLTSEIEKIKADN